MKDKLSLKIEYIKTNELKAYAKNTRKHKDLDIDNIAKSIEKYGFNDAIGIWGENIIVEGHGRLLAAKKLGIKEVPCVRLDHLTDEERREYAIAHNATAELSEWDLDILPDELAELDLSEFDFNLERFEKTSFIQDLLDESFADVKSEERKMEFSLSFTFPYSVKQSFDEYIKSKSKNKLVELLMKEVVGNGN